MNIRIRKAGKKIYFEDFGSTIGEAKLGVTNIWNFKEIIFDEKKLEETFIQNFLKGLFEKEKIEEVHLEYHSMISLVCSIICEAKSISYLSLDEKQTVPSETYHDLKKLKFIKTLECYQMTDYLFHECMKSLGLEIIYQKKEFIKSNFMITNDLITKTKIFYKKKVAMYNSYTEDDFLDFDYFLKENKNLIEIDCYDHTETLLKRILSSLIKEKKENIKIIIFQNHEEQKEIENVLKSIKKNFKEKLKSRNIKIEIKYTKKYKEKYFLKQFNLNIFRIILLLLLLFSASIYSISKFHKYNSEKVKNEVQQIVDEKIDSIKEEPIKEEQPKPKDPVTPKKEEPKVEKPKIYKKNFNELKKINSEFTYYLTVPNTSIAYPVVKHNDNKYYLTHSFDKSYNIQGWLFMDYRNNPNLTDQNTIIYGHDTYENSLFGTLKNTLKPSWYQKNKTITLESSKGKITAEIISIYTISTTDDYLQIVFSNKEFETFLEKITSRSIYNFNNKPKVTDKIITLSTCYKDDRHRLVLHAKISS